jgi:hypothetical protein
MMYARTVTFALPPERLEQAIGNFKEGAERARQHPGFQHGYWLYDRGHERIVAVVLFDNEKNSEASWAIQEPFVRERLSAFGVTPEVHTHEVVHAA